MKENEDKIVEKSRFKKVELAREEEKKETQTGIFKDKQTRLLGSPDKLKDKEDQEEHLN